MKKRFLTGAAVLLMLLASSSKSFPSNNIPETELNLLLVGTMTGGDSPSAIIKTGTHGSKFYKLGTTLDIDGEKVRLVRISKCSVTIERENNYEKLECEKEFADSTNTPRVQNWGLKFSTPLSGYKIVHPKSKKRSNKPLADAKSLYEKDIVLISNKYGIDPNLVKAIIKVESNFNPLAVSPKNAMGIMQLIPATAEDYGVENPFNPGENIEGGIRLLSDLLDYFGGDLRLALAAYNAGKGSVIKYGYKIPPYDEAINYVKKVIAYYTLLDKAG